MRGIKNALLYHIKSNTSYYIASVLTYFLGIAAGMSAVKLTKPDTLQRLCTYMISNIEAMKSGGTLPWDVFAASAAGNTKLLIYIWVSSLTFIGIAAIGLLIFYKGFSTGYTIGILSAITTKRAILAIFATLPQNLIFLPALFFLGAISLKLSMEFFHICILHRHSNEDMKAAFIKHTFLTLLSALLIVIAAFIEGYISLPLMRIWG